MNEEHTSQNYESRVRTNRFHSALKLAVIILIVAACVLTPVFYIWQDFMTRNNVVRDSKNVIRNVEMLGIIYSGTGDPIVDPGRKDGMSKLASEKVKLYSGVDGEIILNAWDSAEQKVLSLTYIKGKYIVYYRYDQQTQEFGWDVYRLIQKINND